MQSAAQTVEDYLAELPPDRRLALGEVRKAILENLPSGFEEAIDFGMIGYVVPLETYPKTYNGHPLDVCGVGISEKPHVAVPHVHLLARRVEDVVHG